MRGRKTVKGILGASTMCVALWVSTACAPEAVAATGGDGEVGRVEELSELSVDAKIVFSDGEVHTISSIGEIENNSILAVSPDTSYVFSDMPNGCEITIEISGMDCLVLTEENTRDEIKIWQMRNPVVFSATYVEPSEEDVSSGQEDLGDADEEGQSSGTGDGNEEDAADTGEDDTGEMTTPDDASSVSDKESSSASHHSHSKKEKTSKEHKSGSLQRIAGADRYKTMKAVIEASFNAEETKTIVVASGENYPDALAASGLAGVQDAPIVITQSESLSPEAKEIIQSYGNIQKAYVIGGEDALNSSVFESLAGLGLDVERVGGKDRYATARAIYDREGGWGNVACVASGCSPADALSLSSLAWKMDAPVFLTDKNGKLENEDIDLLRCGVFSKIIVVGGKKVVDKETEEELVELNEGAEVIRLHGENRYETSYQVAVYEQKYGLTSNNMYLVSGENGPRGEMRFADALSAGPCAGANDVTMMLVGDTPYSRKEMEDLNISGSPRVIGGTKVINSNLFQVIKRTLS